MLSFQERLKMVSSFNPSLRRQRNSKMKRVLEVTPCYRMFKYDYKSLQTIGLNVHLSTLSRINKEQASRLINGTSESKPGHPVVWLGYEKIDALVSYPLDQWYKITIPYTLSFRKSPMDMNLGVLCWYVAKAYSDIIYIDWKKYGIWGHNMTDLHIERVILKPFQRKTYAVMEFGS